MIASKVATLKVGRNGTPNGEISPFTTQAQAAQRFGISRDSVKAARKVQDKGSAQLQKAVEDGKIAISAAQKLLDLTPENKLI